MSTRLDDVLWSLTDQDLQRLALVDLPKVAAGVGQGLPQITVTAVLADHGDPISVLEERGTGVAEVRRTSWGGLVQAVDGGSRYVVMVWVEGNVVVLAGTPPYTDERWRRVQRWVRAGAPRLTPVVLGQRSFQQLARGLESFGSVGVSRMTARVLADVSSYSRGWLRGSASLQLALDEIDEGMILSTLSVSVGERLSVHLRRASGATYYSGDWLVFLEAVVEPLRASVHERRQLLRDQQRPEGEPVTSRIVMSLGSDQLASPASRQRLIDSVREISQVRAAIMHRNPYLHMLVTDHLDGSIFDVFVTDNGSLDVIPGHGASIGALGRFTDAVAEVVGMMEIRGEPFTEISEAEFLAAT